MSTISGYPHGPGYPPDDERNCWPVGPANGFGLASAPGLMGRAGGMAGVLGLRMVVAARSRSR